MSLPPVPMPTGSVLVGDVDVPVRGLFRSETIHLHDLEGNLDAAETYLLAQGTGVSEAEAKAWRDSTPAAVAGLVIDKIVELSGLSEGASKSG